MADIRQSCNVSSDSSDPEILVCFNLIGGVNESEIVSVVLE